MQFFPQSTKAIFIASSGKMYRAAETLSKSLEVHGFRMVPWKKPGVFNLSDYTMEALERESKKCDFGIFILSADDPILFDTEEKKVSRDNVVLELGLFMGKMGRRRSFMLIPEGHAIKKPSDLDGITWGSFKATAEGSYDFTEATIKILEAVSRASKSEMEDALTSLVFPDIILKYCFYRFNKFIHKFIMLVPPRLKCDAQITICTRKGTVLFHPRLSSLLTSAFTHQGKVISSSIKGVTGNLPYKSLIESGANQWIIFADEGQSQYYIPNANRRNNRICILHGVRRRRLILILEIHQEINQRLDEEHYRYIVDYLPKRIEALTQEVIALD